MLGSPYPYVASSSSSSTRPPLAPGTNVTQGAVRLQSSHPVWGFEGGKPAWADLEDSSTEEKELHESNADGNRPDSSRAEAKAEPSNAAVAARATPPIATFANEDEYRYEENGPRVYHMTQEITERRSGLLSDSITTDLSGSSNTISNSLNSEERHFRNRPYRDRDSILSGSSSVTSSSFKIESDIETLSSQDDQVPETPHFTAQELELIKETVPRDEDGNLTSKGSMLHEEGTCTPCLFVHRNVGCHNGMLCTFCHFPHKRRGKARPCKDKRDRFQRRVEHMEKKMEAEPHRIVEDPTWPEKLVQELPPSIEGNQALKSKLMVKLYRHAEKLLADQNILNDPEVASALESVRHLQPSDSSTQASLRDGPPHCARAGEVALMDFGIDMEQPLTGSRAGISTKTSL